MPSRRDNGSTRLRRLASAGSLRRATDRTNQAEMGTLGGIHDRGRNPWALERHWSASAVGDQDTEHDIYADDAICDYPQSGGRIIGRQNLQALRSHHPGKLSGFRVIRILGSSNLWITEYTITYT